MLNARYANADNTSIIVTEGNRSICVDNDDDMWQEAIALNPRPYNGGKAAIDQVTPAQIRLALYRAGLLDQVQAIADSDPEASIVWEYATTIYRNSPFIEALKGNFTDEQIDQLFATAAEIL